MSNEMCAHNPKDIIPQDRPITTQLIRKRSEHNENMISNLEEIALHQEELTSMGATLGKVCGKTLRILLLQNNVISNLDSCDMKYFKVLEYLNLALNNLTTISGLDGNVNEALTKIDLTLNFIDYDELDKSLSCLATLPTLKELFMMGNPCCLPTIGNDNEEDVQDLTPSPTNSSIIYNSNTRGDAWGNFRMYVIFRLPTLEFLDGNQILRSDRIKAMQMKSILNEELSALANLCKKKKSQIQKRADVEPFHEKIQDIPGTCPEEEKTTHHCPEDRVNISNEMFMQKAEKERIEKANQPKLKGEKEFEEDQQKAIVCAREREERGDIKQCNEGKLVFTFNEELSPGHLTLDIAVQKHLSSSLIDVDIHPTYICVIIKSKVLRLILPLEVKAEDSTAKRSLTTGHLLITMPKFNPNDTAYLKSRYLLSKNDKSKSGKFNETSNVKERRQPSYSKGLQQQLVEEAQKEALGPVHIRNIVSEKDGGIKQGDNSFVDIGLKETFSRPLTQRDLNDNHAPPPIF